MFEELKDYIASHTKEILIKDFEEKKSRILHTRVS